MLHGITYLFLPEASQQFLSHLSYISTHIDTQFGFPVQYSYSLKSTLHYALVNSQLAIVLWVMLSVGITATSYWLLRKRTIEDPLYFITGLFLTFWIAPYVMVYDLSILIVYILLLNSKNASGSIADRIFWISPLLGLLFVSHFASPSLNPIIHIGSIGILLATITQMYQTRRDLYVSK